MRINRRNRRVGIWALGLALIMGAAAPAMSHKNTPDETEKAATAPPAAVVAGQKQVVRGVIVQRNPDRFLLRDPRGNERSIILNDHTKVEERKSNPFRSATPYTTAQLLRGLNVEVKGRTDDSGALIADRIRFRNDDYRFARTVESSVTPVENRVDQAEGRLKEAETRLDQSEQNAQRLSGQIQELSATSNAIRGEARTAQERADAAIAGVLVTNQRIAALDDYEIRQTATVNFKGNSSRLTEEAKRQLDELATQAKNEAGFVIEVTGFASAEGNKEANRRLSQRRADAVIQYLVEDQNISLHQIVTPHGYGATQPVADNGTPEGRQQNRRVEVRILVSRGLTSSVPERRPTTGSPE